MGRLVARRWEAQHLGMSRRDRGGCDYQAFVPDPLAGWDPMLPADVAADLADAEASCRQLNSAGVGRLSSEGLARFLLRAESVASSRIEGLDVGARRLLDAELVGREGIAAPDRVAVEVLANIAAMDEAIALATVAPVFALDELLAIHRTLMERSPTPQIGGQVRTTQNWIGGSSYNPCDAAFVPPPPEEVHDLLADLLLYVNGDDHPAIMQAALAHAQFETIHPFADGNGRTGRALIHVVLRRRGVAPRLVPPVSLVLATSSSAYIAGLGAFRHVGAADDPARSVAAVAWLRTFAPAVTRSCADAERCAARIAELTGEWRGRLGSVRANSAVALLLDRLAGAPVLTVQSAATLIGRSTVRVAEAIDRLVEAGVLRQRNVTKQRYRIFEAPEVIALLTGLERAPRRGRGAPTRLRAARRC